jgi:hypothetical protein
MFIPILQSSDRGGVQMDQSPKSEEEYDLGAVQTILAMESIADADNLSFDVYTDVETGNASLKNLVLENCTQGSVRGRIFNETNPLFKEE